MVNNYRESFAEVLYIIQNSEKDVANKIPQKIIQFLEKNKAQDYKVDIDFSNENWINKLKSETRAFISLLYIDYLVSSDEKKRLIKKKKEEERKREEELRKLYNPDNLFKPGN